MNVSQRPVEHRIVECFGETVTLPAFEGDERFYERLTQGKWEPETFAAIAQFANRETTFIDIGAWIGAMSFWAARKARAVVAVEPDPVSFERLAAVAPRNGNNVRLISAALSDQPTVTLYAKKSFGRSSSSAVAGDPTKKVEVKGVTLAQLMDLCDGPAFVKIDIEGLEYRLRGMIADQAGPRIQAFQLAIHPHLYARSLPNPGLTRRVHVFRETLRLFQDFPGYQLARPSNARTFLLTAVGRILLRRKSAGWDALYVRVGAGQGT